MATLNDRRIFDFEAFLQQYSEIIWPLFVWNIWAYRYGRYSTFSMLDFFHIVLIERLNFYHPEQTLEALRHRVNAKISRLQKIFPQGRDTYKPLMKRLLSLGLTPQTTYLYMRGREREIRHLAEHAVQMQNELAAYQHAVAPVEEMLRKHTGYRESEPYKRIQDDIKRLIDRLEQKRLGGGNEEEAKEKVS